MVLEEQLKMLPNHPGVYLMKNAAGQVIYVGKAVSLKNRVRSYFQNSRNHSPKTQAMVALITSIDYILVDSEVEALILENNLIKEHNPRYNIRLKDDKTYPYIKITTNENFPRVYATRKVVRDGAKYYGPYTDVDAMHETVRVLKSVYPIRDCRKPIKTDPAGRPCLNYHINKCLGPCIGGITIVDYADMIKKIEQFLEGKQDTVLKDLRSKMEKAACELDFESAADVRDKLASLQKIIEKQKIITAGGDDHDVVAFARNDKLACVQVFLVRDGRMVGREHFYLEVSEENTESEILMAFLARFYDDAPYIPKEIIIQVEILGNQTVETWLTGKRGSKVTLHSPKRGDKVRLVEMGERNARMLLEQADLKRGLEETKVSSSLRVIAEYLNLEEPPKRIECYDISNIQGNQTVASMVVFEDGRPLKSNYRKFKIKTVEGPNDFASMAEVIGRRFTRALGASVMEPVDESLASMDDKVTPNDNDESFMKIPDLVIIDGGKGQLGAAREVMESLGFGYVPTAGLAKEFEHLFVPGNPDPIILPRDSEALYLVQRIRDEAHRFAITFHRNLRGKAQIQSVLDEIPGIGKKRRLALLQVFGSVDKIRRASKEELADVPGMNRDVAERVYDHLRTRKRDNGKV